MIRTRAARALARGLVLALVTAVTLLGWRPPTAFAEDAASCQSSGGVYVYIQPGGGGCSHAGGSGMTILRSLTSVNTNSTGMICQLGGYPSTCPDPVPANDYWAYWFWSGTAWTYASVGAAADWPNPGDVRAWTFGNDVYPGETPPKPAAPSAAATTTSSSAATTSSGTTSGRTATSTTSSTTTRAATTRTTTARATTTRGAPARTPTPSTSASSGGPTGSPGSASAPTTPSPPGDSGTATPVAVIATSPTSAKPRGTPWGAVATAGLVLLAGTGTLVARRRRRS